MGGAEFVKVRGLEGAVIDLCDLLAGEEGEHVVRGGVLWGELTVVLFSSICRWRSGSGYPTSSGRCRPVEGCDLCLR